MSGFEVEEEVAIRRSRREVYDFVVDMEHLPAWRTGVSRVRRTSEVGYRLQGRLLGRRIEWAYEVTAREPGELLSGRMTSKRLVLEETYTFAGPDDRMWVRLQIAAGSGGPRAFVAWAVRRQVGISLRRLRGVLEGPTPDAEAPYAEEPDELPQEEPVTPA